MFSWRDGRNWNIFGSERREMDNGNNAIKMLEKLIENEEVLAHL